MKYTLSDRAYCKLILHALKHPLRSVCGALVGKANGDVVEVIDAIPYLHSTVSVAPNAEIALEQSSASAPLPVSLTMLWRERSRCRH